MKRSHFSFTLLSILITSSLVFLTACSDDHEDDHQSVTGIILSIDGNMVAVQEAGTITYAAGDAITVPVGGETETVTVRFFDDDGHSFQPESGEYGLGYIIGNSEILGVTHPVGNDEWALRLSGIQTGSTTVRFTLLHDGHSDFTSTDFQVIVE